VRLVHARPEGAGDACRRSLASQRNVRRRRPAEPALRAAQRLDGAVLEGADVCSSLARWHSCAPVKPCVVVSLAATASLRPGTYRGTIQADGAPGLWLPLRSLSTRADRRRTHLVEAYSRTSAASSAARCSTRSPTASRTAGCTGWRVRTRADRGRRSGRRSAWRRVARSRHDNDILPVAVAIELLHTPSSSTTTIVDGQRASPR